MLHLAPCNGSSWHYGSRLGLILLEAGVGCKQHFSTGLGVSNLYSNNTELITGHVEPLDAESLWCNFRRRGDCESRNQLVEHYKGFCRDVSKSVFLKLGNTVVDFQDCFHHGLLGLFDAIDNYEPKYGAGFEAYARYRIRGEILNNCRRYSDISSYTHYLKRIKQDRLASIQKLSIEGGGKNSALSALVSITVDLGYMYLIENVFEFQEFECQLTAYSSPDQDIFRRQFFSKLDNLSDTQMKIIDMHYFQDVSFSEISKHLGVTRGRVSQLHGQAIRSFRADNKLTSYFC